jgi:hypothetical protein
MLIHMSTGKSTACSAAISSDGLKGFKGFSAAPSDLLLLFSLTAAPGSTA